MKINRGKIIVTAAVCLLLMTSACQTTSNQVLDKKSDEIVQTPYSRPQSDPYLEDVTRQPKKRDIMHSSNILKKRDIRRSRDGIVVEKQIKDTTKTTISKKAAISDKKRRKLLRAADRAINAQLYEYAIKKIDAILKKQPDDGTALALKKKVQLLQTAERATEEERYEDAIKVAEKILKDNPDDGGAIAFIENAQILQEGMRHRKILAQVKKVDVYERDRYFENLKEKSIPYNDLMQFPLEDEWEDIKGRAQKEDPAKRLKENRKHTERLEISPSPVHEPLPQDMQAKMGEKLSIEFINTPLRDVIAFLQEKSQMNFFLDDNAQDIDINIKLNDVPLSVILEYLLPKGTGYLVKDNVVYISKESLELRVYDVRDLLINLDDRQSLSTQSSASTTEEDTSPAGEGKDTFDRVKEIIDLITGTIEPQSWKLGTGGGRGLIAAREGMLGDIVVTQSVGIHKRVEGLLAALRSSADIQIAIEARFISVSDNFLEAFGNNINEFDLSEGADAPKRHGIFNETGDSFIDTGTTSALGATTGINLTYQIFDGLFLKGFLKAVQESDEAETVTAPKITLSNTQRGTIKVVTTINYIESYTIVSQTPQPVMSEIDDGTTFNVRPIVSADRKYVSLEVHPVITSVSFTETPFVTGGASTTGGGATAVTATNLIQRPLTVKQELSVTVSVPDKGILMIGGLGKSAETKTSTGVPILSKIPILKRLFSSDTIRKDINLADNLIILIKPTILIREEEEARAFTKGNKRTKIRYPTYGQ